MVFVVRSWSPTESGFCCFGSGGMGLLLLHIQCYIDLPLRRGREWPWTPSLASHCLKDKLGAYQRDPVIGAGREGVGKPKEEGQICVCVCVRLWQGIAYFSYPTLPLSSSAEQLSSDCTVSSCCSFYFLIYFGQMVDYRSRRRLNAAAVTREHPTGIWLTGFSGWERLYLLHFSDPKYLIKSVSDSSLTRAQMNTLICHVDHSFIYTQSTMQWVVLAYNVTVPWKDIQVALLGLHFWEKSLFAAPDGSYTWFWTELWRHFLIALAVTISNHKGRTNQLKS